MDYATKRQEYIENRDANFASFNSDRLTRSINAHRGKLTNQGKLITQLIAISAATPSKRTSQELERLKRDIDDKCADIEAGYEILLNRAVANSDAEREIQKSLDAALAAHATLSRDTMAALAIAPAATLQIQPRASADEGSVKPKENLKPKTLTMEFKPQEYQSWQDKYKIYYTASRMANGSNLEQRGYLYSCIEESLQANIGRTLPETAEIFRTDEADDTPVCFDVLDDEFERKYPTATRRYDLFSMKQPRGKSMSSFYNSLLDAADTANIYTMTTAELIITLTIAACTDDLLRRELVKAKIKDLGILRDEINAFETEVNTARRLAPAQESKAYAAVNRPPGRNKDKRPQQVSRNPPRCYRCNDPNHKTRDCKIKKDSVTCGKCNKPGHITKACRGIGKPLEVAKRAMAEETEEPEFSNDFPSDSPSEYANAVRNSNGTPPLIL